MNLDNVTVEMRPRSEWEAVDFGARLVRRDAASIYKIWFALTLPMVLLAMLVALYTPFGSIAMLLYWWLEPITDGPILRIISRRLFGESADVRSALRALPYLTRRNWIFLLTPYRFHLARSIAVPVTQLEGLRGEERRNRSKALGLKISNYGIGVTVVYHHLLTALYIGFFLLGFALIPAAYQESIGLEWLGLTIATEQRAAAVISLSAFYVAQSFLHPWFVGAGFGLYINCRTQLEAWDIEVAFRRMVQRRVAPLLVVGALLAAMPVPPAQADEVPAQQAAEAAEEPAAAATELLTGEDFAAAEVEVSTATGEGRIAGYWSEADTERALRKMAGEADLATRRPTEKWERKEPGDEPEPSGEFDGAWFDWLEGLARVIAVIFEFGLWLAVAGLLLLIFVTREHWLPFIGIGGRAVRPRRKVVISSGEITAESLPDDIPAEARRLWQAGQFREALSLLYRGSLFVAVQDFDVRLPDSATEGLCVRALHAQAPAPQAQFFDRIVRAWVRCAYGIDRPSDADVLPLCHEWPEHFGATE